MSVSPASGPSADLAAGGSGRSAAGDGSESLGPLSEGEGAAVSPGGLSGLADGTVWGGGAVLAGDGDAAGAGGATVGVVCACDPAAGLAATAGALASGLLTSGACAPAVPLQRSERSRTDRPVIAHAAGRNRKQSPAAREHRKEGDTKQTKIRTLCIPVLIAWGPRDHCEPAEPPETRPGGGLLPTLGRPIPPPLLSQPLASQNNTGGPAKTSLGSTL